MLNVLLDLGNASSHSGTGVAALGLLDALNQYRSDDVCAKEAGISLVGNTLRPVRRLVYLWRLQKLVRRGFNGTHVVHFANFFVPQKRKHVAYVSVIHDLDAVQCPEVYSRHYSTYCRRAYSKACQRTEAIITDTEVVAESIRDMYQLPKHRVKVTGIGLRTEFTAQVDKVRNRLRETEVFSVPRLLYVGQANKKKNTAWLVQSVVKGVKSGALPKMELILAGSAGFGSDEVRKELLNSGGIVRWYNSPPLEDVVKMYLSAAAVVIPSLREGFGIPMLEAMYCDKPIVASRIPTSVEVAGSAAHFFTLGDRDEFFEATKSALTDRNTLQRKRAALIQLHKYSWKNLVPRYVDAYKEAYEEAKST